MAHAQLLVQTTAPHKTITGHLHLSAGCIRAHVHIDVLWDTVLCYSNVKESRETAFTFIWLLNKLETTTNRPKHHGLISVLHQKQQQKTGFRELNGLIWLISWHFDK